MCALKTRQWWHGTTPAWAKVFHAAFTGTIGVDVHTKMYTVCREPRNQGWNKATHAAQERTIRINSHWLSVGFECILGHKPFAVAKFSQTPYSVTPPYVRLQPQGLRSCPSVECSVDKSVWEHRECHTTHKKRTKTSVPLLLNRKHHHKTEKLGGGLSIHTVLQQ